MGNTLSSTLIDEKIIVDPVDQIVVKVAETQDETTESTTESSSSEVIGIGIVAFLVYMGYKLKKRH